MMELTSLYVTGLPNDIKEEELEEFFQRAGSIYTDLQNKKKIKVYRDNNEHCKGDALIGYEKQESV